MKISWIVLPHQPQVLSIQLGLYPKSRFRLCLAGYSLTAMSIQKPMFLHYVSCRFRKWNYLCYIAHRATRREIETGGLGISTALYVRL